MLTVAGKTMFANLEMEGRTDTAAPMSSPKCNPRSKVSCYLLEVTKVEIPGVATIIERFGSDVPQIPQ